ncbi:DegV family EDD domain-containing protein, partial [Escherichia coli]|nr:DegV family EDD domain-containing protein [Escherichia coli]
MSTRENFLDKITLDSGDIREKINRGDSFSTSQPSIQTVDSLLSFLENKYDHVLVLTVSAELSGTYQLISQRIKENQYSSDWIQIIDTKKNSVAQGLLVEAAVELAKSDIDFTELVRKIKEIRSKAFIYVSVPDLTPMIKSGRVPKLLGKITQTVS